jgi:hypothetical protein
MGSGDGKKWRWEEVEMGRSGDGKKWRWEEVEMGRSGDGQKLRWERQNSKCQRRQAIEQGLLPAVEAAL